MTRECRHSDAGKDRNRQRKSRAGEDRHPSGNYVRRVRPSEEQSEIDEAPTGTPKPVTVPSLRFLGKKQIAGEWL
jgi:hypothetical protein